MINDIQTARLLGLASLGLGAVGFVANRQTSRALGLGKPHVVASFGGREIFTGLMAMGFPDRAWPIWGRVAGDVADLAVLAVALGSGNRRRHNAAWAAIAVLGLTAIDVATAVSLSRRDHQALATARRTRIPRKLGAPLPNTAGALGD